MHICKLLIVVFLFHFILETALFKILDIYYCMTVAGTLVFPSSNILHDGDMFFQEIKTVNYSSRRLCQCIMKTTFYLSFDFLQDFFQITKSTSRQREGINCAASHVYVHSGCLKAW